MFRKANPGRQGAAPLVLLLLLSVHSLSARDVVPGDLKFFTLSGGELRVEYVSGAESSALDALGKDGMYFSPGSMLFLKFGFSPIKQITGRFQINILGQVPDKRLELFYGQRGSAYYALTTAPTNGLYPLTPSGFKKIEDNNRVELYTFDITFDLDSVKFTAFHHIPRYHWGNEGDMFGLLWEATDMDTMDLYDAKAPSGLEMSIGSGPLRGLKVLVGPEVYWDANPKGILKYWREFGPLALSFMHSEDFARRTSTTIRRAIPKATRKTTLGVAFRPAKQLRVEVGTIIAGTEKIGENFIYTKKTLPGMGLNGSDYNAYMDHIMLQDTFGAKARFGIDLTLLTLEGRFEYAGLVADGGNPLREKGTLMPYSGLGNKAVMELSLGVHAGPLHIVPRFMIRKNVMDATPTIEPMVVGTTLYPGVAPRNSEDDPFAVNDNRECLSMEVVLTWDPTAGTWFYNWDNRIKEDAPFACNLVFNYTRFTAATDGYTYWHSSALANKGFLSGLPKENVWAAMSRLYFNPSRKLRIVGELEAGFQQAAGFAYDDDRPYRAVTYYGLGCNVQHRRFEITGKIKKDAWGPYDYYREFNFTYPWQFLLDACVKFNDLLGFVNSSRLGVRWIHRKLDADSLPEEWQAGKNSYLFEITTYYSIAF